MLWSTIGSLVGILASSRLLRIIARKWKDRTLTYRRVIVAALVFLLALAGSTEPDNAREISADVAAVGYFVFFFMLNLVLGFILVAFAKRATSKPHAVEEQQSELSTSENEEPAEENTEPEATSFENSFEAQSDGSDQNGVEPLSFASLSSERMTQIREEEEYRASVRKRLNPDEQSTMVSPSPQKETNDDGSILGSIISLGVAGMVIWLVFNWLNAKPISETDCEDLVSVVEGAKLKNVLGLPIKIIRVESLSQMSRSSTSLKCRGKAHRDDGRSGWLTVTATEVDGRVTYLMEMP